MAQRKSWSQMSMEEKLDALKADQDTLFDVRARHENSLDVLTDELNRLLETFQRVTGRAALRG